MSNPEASAPASPQRLRIKVGGMTCQNCARHVREALEAVDGVKAVDVNLSGGEASVLVAHVGDETRLALAAAVTAAGYVADAGGPQADARVESPDSGGAWNSHWPMIAALAVTALLMAGEWLLNLHHHGWFRWLAFVLASGVQFYSGLGFYRGAWRQLQQGRSSMDTLVALGSTTAYVLSVAVLWTGHGGHLHFMEATAIIGFISLGHWLEARVSRRAEGALRDLMQLAPDEALRQEPDGSERRVAVADLKLNDAVVLRPGDIVPTDGTVIDGDSALDESMLTGESLPVDKTLHSRLYAGTHNLNGRLVMLVTGTGERTALARVIEAVQRAQSSRASIQRLADRVSNVFVPVVVLLAVASGLWWGLAPVSARAVHDALAARLWATQLPAADWAAALVVMAAVLIVACPCALGLATPAAIMVAANSAARRGILIRDGVALEKAGQIDTVIFDKTGTLTTGRPKLVRFESYRDDPDRPAYDEMRVAVTLAGVSNHPVSRAVAAYGCEPYLVVDCRELRGRGIEARVKASKPTDQPMILRLGSLRWLESLAIDFAPAREFARDWMGRGATVLGVAAGSHLLGVLAVRDELKPGAAAVVADLQRAGWDVHMVTGDHEISAQAVAAEVGIPARLVQAEASPDAKPEYVQRLQMAGHRVAFIGDGINDAPALEKADLGIAVSLAAEIARKAADLVLLRADIAAVPEALGLARVTLRRIRQNLFWAFCYNVGALPLAATGFLNPMLCAVLMGLSDLVVVGNALTLYWWRPFRRERFVAAIRESIDDPDGP